jgi:hypothetical protein
MKNLIFAITLIVCFNNYAQDGVKKANIFVRVYDLQGNKIGKGRINYITDTLLHLSRNKEYLDIPVRSIGTIKTNRSAGNNILVGAATGATALAIFGVATSDRDPGWIEWNAGEGAVLGVVVGGIGGAAIGGITVLFKNPVFFEINGSALKLKAFKELISGQ